MMSVWKKYPAEYRKEYILFLQMYGALSNLFRQKKGDLIPYLDSKFQETIFAKCFNSQNVDISNTPHDVLSVFGDERVGIGIKTWMGNYPSYQKVMQIKRYKDDINNIIEDNDITLLAKTISEIKNERLISDYKRLGLTEDKNIYHYVTREKGVFFINECPYTLVDVNSIKIIGNTSTSLMWTDGIKDYRYTYGDSQIWQRFDSQSYNTKMVESFNVRIMEDPFTFLLNAYLELFDTVKVVEEDVVEVYLPLYSYRTKEVEIKSGLNAWNAAPKNKDSSTPRPLNEVYIPIPREFHKKAPDFFVENIFSFEDEVKSYKGNKANKPELRFHLQLPNGDRIPSLVTQSNMKGLQSGSNTEYDSDGKRFGQAALGQWLLVDVLGLRDRTLVTRDWLKKKGTDSVRLWRNKNDRSLINIDFAPYGAFEAFMDGKPIPEEDSID